MQSHIKHTYIIESILQIEILCWLFDVSMLAGSDSAGCWAGWPGNVAARVLPNLPFLCGTRWDTVGRLLPKSGNTRTHSESDRDATGCYWALGGRCMFMP